MKFKKKLQSSPDPVPAEDTVLKKRLPGYLFVWNKTRLEIEVFCEEKDVEGQVYLRRAKSVSNADTYNKDYLIYGVLASAVFGEQV